MEQKRVKLMEAPTTSPKIVKKDPKMYCFDLELGESNDRTYPEFCWRDLVSDFDAKAVKSKAKSGKHNCNP